MFFFTFGVSDFFFINLTSESIACRTKLFGHSKTKIEMWQNVKAAINKVKNFGMKW